MPKATQHLSYSLRSSLPHCNTIVRNGVAITLPDTRIEYNWKLDKQGSLKDLDTMATIKGVEKYTFNYKKSTNTT